MKIGAYFDQYEQARPECRSLLHRGSFALRRNGLETMEELCELCRSKPEQLAEVRSIGPQTLPLILAVCAKYQGEQEQRM
jgi:hypothetical protein